MKNLQLNPSEADISGPTTVDSTAPKGLLFHYADEAKPLATPWQVAIERAKLVRKCKLPQGPILDQRVEVDSVSSLLCYVGKKWCWY